jgi:hypothetical protein
MADGTNYQICQVNKGKYDQAMIASFYQVVNGFAEKVKAQKTAQHFQRE